MCDLPWELGIEAAERRRQRSKAETRAGGIGLKPTTRADGIAHPCYSGECATRANI